LILVEALNVFSNVENWGFPTESNLAAVWWKVLSDGVLDNTEEHFGGCGGSDGEFVKELNHKTCETLECTRNAYGGVDLHKDTFGGLNVNLELSSLVEWGIQEC